MGSFEGSTAADAKEFASRWLPAWTGNDPERLAAFYTDDAFYRDPAVPDGVRGKEALLAYFRALLGPSLTGNGPTPALRRWRADSSTTGTRVSRSGPP